MTTELVPRNGNTALLPSMTTLDDTMTLGKVLAQSGFFADAREAAQAVVKVLAGQELGFGPVASMTGVNIIKGRVSLSANMIAAAVKRSGRYNYRTRRLDATACEIEFFERAGGAWESVGISTFTDKDANKAATQNMDKFPRNMLFARAMSNGAKWYCADVFGGPVYTPDELGAVIDGETGEVLSEGTARAATPPPPAAVQDAPAVEPQVGPMNGTPTRNSLNRALHAVMRDAGIQTSDRAARHWWCSQRLGHPVESVADLTDEEVRTVTIWLQNLQPNDLAKMHVQYAAFRAAPPADEEADPFADPPTGKLLDVPAAHPSGPGH